MLYPHNVLQFLIQAAHWADREVRTDLQLGYIAGENDYTSNFTGTLRRKINAANMTGLQATSFVLNAALERQFGADACIVFANDTEFKIGLFEAKWPRLTTRVDYWDALQRSSGISHFDSQLARQAVLLPRFAIWEMFYMEHPFGAGPPRFPMHGSACFWSKDVQPVSAGRTQTSPWTDAELLALAPVHDIGHIVGEICRCHVGTAIAGDDYRRALNNVIDAPATVLLIKYDRRLADRPQERGAR